MCNESGRSDVLRVRRRYQSLIDIALTPPPSVQTLPAFLLVSRITFLRDALDLLQTCTTAEHTPELMSSHYCSCPSSILALKWRKAVLSSLINVLYQHRPTPRWHRMMQPSFRRKLTVSEFGSPSRLRIGFRPSFRSLTKLSYVLFSLMTHLLATQGEFQ